MTILVSGALSYDVLLTANTRFTRLFDSRSNKSLSVGFHVESEHVSFGGPAANIAFHLARQGVDAHPIAAVGSDFAPYDDWLEENGISKSGLLVVPHLKTPRAYIQTDVEQNQILAFCVGAMRESCRCAIPSVQPSMCVIGPDDRTAILKRLEQFPKLRAPILFDPGQAITALEPGDIRQAITVCDLMIVNDYELHFVITKLGCTRDELIGQLAEGLIVTNGERGSRFFGQDIEHHVAAVPCPRPVDPTGCGDAFRAGLIAARLQGHSLPDAMSAGSLLASEVLSQYGAQGTQVPDTV